MHVSPAARQPRRIVTRTLGLGMSALIAAGVLAWTPAVTSGWNQGAAEATLWQLLNGARVNNGMAPLQQHGTLVSLARWRSSDMLAKDYFSHTIEGCGCLVYAYYDSHGLNYVWGGENIGWNSGLDDSYSPVRVHERFMASPSHRSNALNPAFTHGGVGAAAADGRMFQGYVQNTRMYTELFLQAPAAAAPAPRPPSGGGGGGSGGGGGGGGGGSAAPVQQAAAPAPKPKPQPKPKMMRVDKPAQPVSAAGLDGVRTLVSSPATAQLLARWQADEIAAERADRWASTVAPAIVTASAQVAGDNADLQVQVAAEPEPGPLDGLVSAIIGFLFG